MNNLSLFARILPLVVTLSVYRPATEVHGAVVTDARPARAPENPQPVAVSYRAMAFYYPWYGNPATDGHYANWNHPVAVRNEPPRAFPGGDNIGSNFYPSLGCYSINDPGLLRKVWFEGAQLNDSSIVRNRKGQSR